MNRAPITVLVLLALTACNRSDPQPKASQDARDIAMVAKAQRQRPPVQPIAPEPVSFADLIAPGISIRIPAEARGWRSGKGCHFLAGEQSVLVAAADFALMRVGGALELFASDHGSPTLPGGAHRDYTSGIHTLQLISGEGGGDALTVRDRFGRPVYTATGSLRCGG